jgi:hypothetical protein
LLQIVREATAPTIGHTFAYNTAAVDLYYSRTPAPSAMVPTDSSVPATKLRTRQITVTNAFSVQVVAVRLDYMRNKEKMHAHLRRVMEVNAGKIA